MSLRKSAVLSLLALMVVGLILITPLQPAPLSDERLVNRDSASVLAPSPSPSPDPIEALITPGLSPIPPASVPASSGVQRSCALSGVVFRPDGHPAAGSSLRYILEHNGRQARLSGESGFTGAGLIDHVVADGNGRFLFDELPQGRIVVTADHESGMAVKRFHISASRPVQEATLILAGGESLGGAVVTRDGVRISRARIVPLENKGNKNFRYECEARAVFSDDDGRFRLQHLTPGAWTLHVSAPDFGAAITDEIPTGTETARIVLGAGIELECHVILATSQTPLRDILVSLAHRGREVDAYTARSNVDGVAYFSPVGKGSYVIHISDEQYVLYSTPELVEIDPARRHQPITLLLTEGCQIRGRVLDGNTAEGIPNVVVRCRNESKEIFYSNITGANGDYNITGLPAGTYRVSPSDRIPAYPQDPVEPIEAVISIRAGQILEGVDLVLTPGAPLGGVVLDSSGLPVGDATVRARNVEGTQVMAEYYTAADGRFAFGDYGDGEAVNLSAEKMSAKSGLKGPFLAGAPGSDSIEIHLILECSGLIAGRVVDARGVPVACQVQAFAEEAELQFPVLPVFGRTDFQGNFVLAGVCPGTYTLVMVPPGNSAQHGEIVRLAPQEQLTNLKLVYDLGEVFAVSGIVIDESDLPIQNAQVRLSTLERPPLGVTPSVATDDSGNFHFEGLPEGEYVLHASADGFSGMATATAAAGASDVVMRLPSTHSIQLSVVDKQGGPVTSFTVTLIENVEGDNPPVTFQVADPEGRFTLIPPRNALWHLRIEAPEYTAVEMELDMSASEQDVSDISVALVNSP